MINATKGAAVLVLVLVSGAGIADTKQERLLTKEREWCSRFEATGEDKFMRRCWHWRDRILHKYPNVRLPERDFSESAKIEGMRQELARREKEAAAVCGKAEMLAQKRNQSATLHARHCNSLKGGIRTQLRKIAKQEQQLDTNKKRAASVAAAADTTTGELATVTERRHILNDDCIAALARVQRSERVRDRLTVSIVGAIFAWPHTFFLLGHRNRAIAACERAAK